jgi:hypothetical protein
LTAPCQEIGQQLVAIADAFEMTWLEVLGWVATGCAVAARPPALPADGWTRDSADPTS